MLKQKMVTWYFSSRDASTHAGEFVFQHGVEGTLAHTWSYPLHKHKQS